MAKNPYVSQLRKTLRGTPLAPYAQLIAREEARNKLPRGIIAGIARAETSFGTAGAGPSLNNYWGWMTGAGPPNQRSFPNPQAAIRQYARFLSQNYVGQGLNTPEKIVRKYVGSESPTWVSNVRSVMGQFGGGVPTVTNPGRAPQTTRAPRGEAKRDILPLLLAIASARSSGSSVSALFPILFAYSQERRTGRDVPQENNTTPVRPTPAPRGNAALRIPQTFSITHDTDGLAGYPAHDFMSQPGKSVGAPAAGTIIRISGSNSWKGGGIGGRSIYLRTKNGVYFMTHFAPNLLVKVGDTVRAGQQIGFVGNPTSGMAPHIHVGLNAS